MPECALISIYKSSDIVGLPNILYTILFIVNCNECLSAEFIGQTFVPYNRIGKHFDLINSTIRGCMGLAWALAQLVQPFVLSASVVADDFSGPGRAIGLTRVCRSHV